MTTAECMYVVLWTVHFLEIFILFRQMEDELTSLERGRTGRRRFGPAPFFFFFFFLGGGYLFYLCIECI